METDKGVYQDLGFVLMAVETSGLIIRTINNN